MYPFFLDLINENFPEGEVLKKPGKDHLKENNNSVLITKNTFKESVRDFIVVVLKFFFTNRLLQLSSGRVLNKTTEAVRKKQIPV